MLFFIAKYSGRVCQSESCRKVSVIFRRLKSTVERSPTRSGSSDSGDHRKIGLPYLNYSRSLLTYSCCKKSSLV